MRVVFVAGSAQMGGTQRNVLQLAGALQTQGLSVEVILLAAGGPLETAYQARGIPVITLPWTYRVRNFPMELGGLRAMLRARRPDLVQSFGYPAVWWGVLAALEGTSAGRIIAIQAWDTWKGWSEILLDRTQAPIVHLAIADGEGARQFAIRQQRLVPERTRTVYDGIEVEDLLPRRPRAETRTSLGISTDQVAIGIVARLQDAHKGQSILLKAAPRILHDRPATIFVLVGDGADRSALEALAMELRISDRVRFAGTRTDLGDVLAALDILAIPSLRFESVPKILVEGMAAGRPIVATRVGDIPELLEDGRTGYLIPPGDPTALAEAALACLADPAATTRLGARAQEAIAAGGLSLEATAAKVQALYTDLAQQAPFPAVPPGIRRRIWFAAWLYLAKQAAAARRRRLAHLAGRAS
ncbi:MAG: glycosyltransferase [candidate division NC10 bacterium]|nr:glycosyltransferase [candidate division NC10 bacterium]